MNYAQLVIAAILVEAVWENLKMIWKEGKFNVNMIGSLVLGILICSLAGLDIFSIIGIGLNLPVLGCILTGIIVSRGANFVNDIFSKLKDNGIEEKITADTLEELEDGLGDDEDEIEPNE